MTNIMGGKNIKTKEAKSSCLDETYESETVYHARMFFPVLFSVQ